MLNAFADSHEKLTSCDPPFSFYQLVDELAAQPTANFANARRPLHRFFSLMRKMSVRSFLREKLQLNAELVEEQDMLVSATGNAVAVEATRITCFNSRSASLGWSPEELPDSSLLGYAVVISAKATNFQMSHVYEAIVRPPMLLIAPNGRDLFPSAVSNYYIHNARLETTSIGPRTASRILPIRGSYFAQQNAITHVCAHAALRMAVNSSPLFSARPKLTNKNINDCLKLQLRDVPKGLTHMDMKQVIESIGGAVQIANFYIKPSMEYDHFVYPLMESGCPVILNVRGQSFSVPHTPQSQEIVHALAIMGHTLNTDRWEPEARGGYGSYHRETYVPAAAWTDHLIINDDNFGMLVTLPTDCLRNLLIPDKNPGLHAAEAVGIVPKEVKLGGLLAEEWATSVFVRLIDPVKQFNPVPYWLDRLVKGPLACRTTLQTRDQYISHIEAMTKLLGKILEPALKTELQALPYWLWISELTLPQLYTANRHKIADVILNAEADEKMHSSGASLLAMRLPGYWGFWHTKKNYSFPVTGHTALIAQVDEVRLCDW